MRNTLPLASIRCLTYNHEQYIRQCLDGFVMQKTNFPFEIIIYNPQIEMFARFKMKSSFHKTKRII